MLRIIHRDSPIQNRPLRVIHRGSSIRSYLPRIIYRESSIESHLGSSIESPLSILQRSIPAFPLHKHGHYCELSIESHPNQDHLLRFSILVKFKKRVPEQPDPERKKGAPIHVTLLDSHVRCRMTPACPHERAGRCMNQSNKQTNKYVRVYIRGSVHMAEHFLLQPLF